MSWQFCSLTLRILLARDDLLMQEIFQRGVLKHYWLSPQEFQCLKEAVSMLLSKGLICANGERFKITEDGLAIARNKSAMAVLDQ